jgi:hypothetical protein
MTRGSWLQPRWLVRSGTDVNRKKTCCRLWRQGGGCEARVMGPSSSWLLSPSLGTTGGSTERDSTECRGELPREKVQNGDPRAQGRTEDVERQM